MVGSLLAQSLVGVWVGGCLAGWAGSLAVDGRDHRDVGDDK